MDKTELDTLFSKLIRAKNFCEKCLTKKNTFHCAHIVTRKYLTTRWRRENALCLCAKCHRYFHDHPADFGVWLEKKYPQRREIINEILRTELVKPRDFADIKKKLQVELSSLKPVSK